MYSAANYHRAGRVHPRLLTRQPLSAARRRPSHLYGQAAPAADNSILLLLRRQKSRPAARAVQVRRRRFAWQLSGQSELFGAALFRRRQRRFAARPYMAVVRRLSWLLLNGELPVPPDVTPPSGEPPSSPETVYTPPSSVQEAAPEPAVVVEYVPTATVRVEEVVAVTSGTRVPPNDLPPPRLDREV